MPEVKFVKYQGAGNDFVIIDDRNASLSLNQRQIEHLCDRRFGIGADGLMLLRLSEKVDFDMIYYNSDGRESTMCGNGGRCLVHFANALKAIGRKTTFNAIDGLHRAELIEENIVRLQMIDVRKVEKVDHYYFVDTGSPHVVVFCENVEDLDLIKEARAIRYNDRFKEEGTNVNFVEVLDDGLKIRTYERGVEDETLACGTGVTASAIVANYSQKVHSNNIPVKAIGGDLSVEFKQQNGVFEEVWLTGPATKVYTGSVWVE